MPAKASVSFRILRPESLSPTPSDPLVSEIICAAEFSGSGPARELEHRLAELSFTRRVRLKKGPLFFVRWNLPLSQAEALSIHLKSMPELARQIQTALRAYLADGFWELKGRGNRKWMWTRKTLVMGILNVTPDSFSDGGKHLDPSSAVERALKMQDDGADWIDVGGESSRPGAKAVTAREEKKRILPVLKACVKALRVPLSVDTYKSEVARAAVGEGAQMVNDIGALRLDQRMGRTIAALKVPVILMHMQGEPRTMQKNPTYQEVVGDVIRFFRERIDFAKKCGIREDRILVDPGFGFGKTPWHNIELTRRLWEFKVLGKPIVIGPSLKSTLGFLLGGAPPEERREATGAALTASILQGADWVRVHDVKAAVRVVKIADAIRYDRGLTAP